MKKAIIIFQKNEELGKVKTRLAKEVGDEKALKIYQFLKDYTHRIIQNLEIPTFVYYSDSIEDKDIFPSYYHKCVQIGDDLGERMYHAFHEVFKKGYQSVIIIGTDCYELTKNHLINAFDVLENFDFVIGPATDGGYYLLGSTFLDSTIFIGKEWSSNSVFSATIENFEELGVDYEILPILSDIDNKEDLKDLKNIFDIK